VNTDGDFSLVLDFSLQLPSPAVFDSPQCIPIRQPINHNLKRLTPMAPMWPDSFSISLVLSNFIQSIYVNAQSSSVASVITQTNIPNSPNFQYSSIMINGGNTLYTVTQWLNINPLPCILETNTPFSLWTKPQFTRVSSIQAFDNNNNVQYFDVLASGAQVDNIWIFNGTNPVGFYNTGGNFPGTVSKVIMWNPTVPNSSIFNIPMQCLPRSDMDGKKRNVNRGFLLGPSFPAGFTMYVNGFVIDSQVIEKVFYYDAANQFVRIDYNGYTLLQRKTDVYRYSILPQLNPYPCEYYSAPTLVWAPPVLNDFILNVTFQGSPATVWQDYDHYVPTQYQYWYFDQTNTPVYIIDSTMVGGKVMYFDRAVPPTGIFDVPNFCFTL